MTSPNELPPPPGAPSASNAAAGAPPAAGGPNIESIIKRFLAHLPVALAVIALGVSVTMVMARSRKPTYSSETVIYYREGINRQFVGVQGEGDVLKALPARLKETLLSRAHLEQIIKEFNLYPQIVQADGYLGAVDRLRLKILFKARSAETFLIGFEGSTPEEAQEVTARLADVLIEDMGERKKAQAKTTTDFLETEKKRADEDVLKRETDLARFFAQHPEFANEANADQAGASVRAEKVKATADPGILAMERQQQRLRATLAGKAAGGGPAVGGGAAAIDPILAGQKAAAEQEVAAAEKDLTDKSEKLTDNHPDVKMAKSRVAAAQAKLRDAMAALQAAASAPAPAAPAAKAQGGGDDPYDATPKADDRGKLEWEIAKTERELQSRKRGGKPDSTSAAGDAAAQIIGLETEWKQLNRDRAKARQWQGDIDDRLFKARANAASEFGGYNAQVMVLDPAFLPTQASTMPRGKFIMIGALISALAGLVLAAAWGMFLDDRVFVAEDLAGFAPVLAAVPRGPTEKGKRRG